MQRLTFPQYRKYSNGKTFFRFDSPDSFEEIRVMGSKWLVEVHQARILPDRNHVHDLLYNYHEFAEVIGEEEYGRVRQKAVQQ